MMRRSLLRLAGVLASGRLALRHPWAQQPATAPALYPRRTVVSVADFGALPNGTDAAPGLRKAVAALPKDKPCALVFAPGDYRFAASSEPVLALDELHDLIVDGQGSRWFCEGGTRLVWASGAAGLQFRRIAIDWKRPPFSQGEVIAVAPNGLAADIGVDAEFPIAGDQPVQIQAIATYDRNARAMAVGGIDAINLVTKVTPLRAQALRLEFKRPLPFKTGDTVVLRHQMHGGNLFTFIRCSDVALADLTIGAAPGMAVLGIKCRNFSTDRFRIAPTGSRLMSTCLDGIHLASCAGRIDIANSSFDAMGDDAINVHAGYFEIERRIDARSVLLAHSGAASPDRVEWPASGDTVGFVDDHSLLPLGSARIGAIETGSGTVLHFADNLPESLAAGDWLFDASDQPQVTITNCVFQNNRARGVLAHRNTVIRGCRFRNQFEEAVLGLVEFRALEGPSIEALVIEGNTIEGTNRSGYPSGAIRVSAVIEISGRPGPSPEAVNHNIRVSGNSIAGGHAGAVHVTSTNGAVIAQNRISQPDGPAIVLQDIQAVRVTGNSCVPQGIVQVDKASLAQLAFEGNQGLAVRPQ